MRQSILLYFIYCFLFSSFVLAQKKTIVITEGFDSSLSIATSAYILEDSQHLLTIEQLLTSTNDSLFRKISSEKTDLSFTTSQFWIKFKIFYSGKIPKAVYLQVARPVTNIAELYLPTMDGSYTTELAGDEFPFRNKFVPHRNQLFHFQLWPGQVQTFYLKVASDGEALNLPLVLSDPEHLRKSDYKEQYILGIYYGILGFVFLIYFFFYAALKEKSFLFYILYVLGVLWLQFSLDGFSSQFLFPENPWWGNRSPLISACFGMFFLLKYVKSFLKTKENSAAIHRTLTILEWLIVVSLILVLTSGFTYVIAYPLVNLLSLIGMIMVLVTIAIWLKKGIHVDYFFIAAFVFLIVGVAIFISNNLNLIHSNMITDYSMKLGTCIEVIFLSFSMANKFREMQKAKEEAQAEALEKLEEINVLKDKANVELERQVIERTKEIVHQKEIIEEKNKDIVASITYAKRIQTALLSGDETWNDISPEHFILFKPKDVVSGDFYWAHATDTICLWAVADCTGHGVPGAFMSMIGNSFLNEIVVERGIFETDQILNLLRNKIINALEQKGSSTKQRDGMDIALCMWDKRNNTLHYSGANNPVWIVKGNDSVVELKPDKMPIGYYTEELKPFSIQQIQLEKEDIVYSFSDGYPDQFGGPKGKKYKYKQMQEKFVSIHKETLLTQKEMLDIEFESWKNNLEQIDDVCLVGVKVV